MRVRGLRALGVVLFCLVLSVPGLCREEVPEFGMTLEIPENWFRVPQEAELAKAHPESVLFASDGNQDQCVLFLSSSPSQGRTEQYVVSSTAHYIYTKMFGTVKSEGRFQVDGADGYFLTYEGGFKDEKNYPRRYFRAFVFRGDTLYTFHSSTSWNSFKKHEGTLLDIVKSVEWNSKELGPRYE
jgi:hypothetical protein